MKAVSSKMLFFLHQNGESLVRRISPAPPKPEFNLEIWIIFLPSYLGSKTIKGMIISSKETPPC